MGWLKKKVKQAWTDKTTEMKQDYAANRLIKKKAHAKYLQEKEKGAYREAEGRAKIESDARLKSYKQSKNPQRQFKGFAGPTQTRPNIGLGVADYLTGSSGKGKGVAGIFPGGGFGGSKTAPKRKRRKKGKKGQTIIIRTR